MSFKSIVVSSTYKIYKEIIFSKFWEAWEMSTQLWE